MKKTFRVLFSCLLAIALSFGFLTSNAWATGQFSQTCENIELSGSTLSASCETMSGSYTETEIDLDEYIGNIDGTLKWGDHLFSLTCNDLGLAQSLRGGTYVLAGTCRTRDQRRSATEINLDEHIANIDGQLEFE